MNKKITAILTVSLFLICTLAVTADADADTTESYVMFDMGNGETVWSPISTSSGDKLTDVFSRAASANGITYTFSAGTVTVNGLSIRTVGDTSGPGSFTVSGTTGTTVTSQWKLFSWNGTSWISCNINDLSNAYTTGSFALGFYPDGVCPVETPADRISWTMIRGDSRQTGDQTATYSATSDAVCKWEKKNGGNAGAYASALYAQGLIFIKYGIGSTTGAQDESSLECYDLDGNVKWIFRFPGIKDYEVMTPVIAGDYIYVTSGLGYIFKLPWKTGPGTDCSDVTTFNGAAYDAAAVRAKTGNIPYDTGATLTGSTYSTGCGNLVFNSGCIYCLASNGMTYCFDTDLNLVWSYQMGGHTYFQSPAVYDGFVFSGALNGSMYILDQCTGAEITSKSVFTTELYGKKYGSVCSIAVIKNDSKYYLYASVNEGRGMNNSVGGLMTAVFNGTSIVSCNVDTQTYGLLPNYVLLSETNDFKGAYVTGATGFYKVDLSGHYTKLTDNLAEIHAPAVLVNDKYIYLASYTAGKPNYILDTEGNILSMMDPVHTNYNMSPPLVLGDYVIYGNDDGPYCIYGVFPEYVAPSSGSNNNTVITLAIIAAVIIAILACTWCGLRFIGKKERPFRYLAGQFNSFINGDRYTHNTRNRHRLLIIMIAGFILVVIMFFISLSFGSGGSLTIGEAWSSLCSAIGKGGQNLNYNETLVYSSRFPRTLAAIAVGMGLSIAGSIYQAIIRNPLVDPYIMGVSSGAGTAAIAVIAFDFTFFGLFSSHSPFLIAAAAMVGGILAFLCTTLIAMKAGGNSINFVLAGVVVGLAFSAVQTLMMSMAGNRVSNVLSWLFGSFSNVSWTQLWIIVIPAVALSLAPLIWAKEFNLVLLGEDQAKQMGLNVKAFTICMLTLASVLASVCVAFVGIIGFVGLVVPHLCRMFLGGDHRLVMPTSIVIGGFLMLLADFASRMLLVGQELPVGAITTIIGVPFFAWLLIRKGRAYNG